MDCLRFEYGQVSRSSHEVAVEVPLSIFINNRHYSTAMMSPGMEREFVMGHLFSEGMIKGLEELQSLELEGQVARAVIQNPGRALDPRMAISSGIGDGSSTVEGPRLPVVRSDLVVEPDDVLEAVAAISFSQLHQAAGGTHSVGLFSRDKQSVVIAEDIGRHNALDKAIGYCLSHGEPTGELFAASTSRISSDMALKCSQAQLPLVVSRGATTSLAVAIAERTGLSIVGFARGRKMNVYTNSHRIKGLVDR